MGRFSTPKDNHTLGRSCVSRWRLVRVMCTVLSQPYGTCGNNRTTSTPFLWAYWLPNTLGTVGAQVCRLGFSAQRDIPPLQNVSLENRSAYIIQPNVSTWTGDPAINRTMFLALTDVDLFATPCNLTQLNPHVAALVVYQASWNDWMIRLKGRR